jgi:sugar lactone lactonase YvrE
MNENGTAIPVELWRGPDSTLVESPYWDSSRGAFVWVDILGGTLHIEGEPDTVIRLSAPVPSVQPTVDGGFVVALRDSVVLLDAAGRLERELARVTLPHGQMRLNEGKCDPFGAFVVGSMDETGGTDGAVYRVHGDGRVDVLIESGFGTSNGMEWSDDGSTFFVTDTVAKTVYRTSYDPEGPIGELEPFLTGHHSDGMTMDADGGFWNAIFGEGRVVHWSPDGVIDREVTLPVPNPTGVAFGGPGLDRLFIGTSREGMSEADLATAPLSGAVFMTNVAATGREAFRFRPAV